MTLMLSLEVCLRLYRANKREQDPELDNLTNPQARLCILSQYLSKNNNFIMEPTTD